MPSELWELFLTYPPHVQVALMAAVIGLIGVFVSTLIAFVGVSITNGGHERRLMLQLAAEEQRKRVDREMGLRKDIYLEVAEAIHAGLNAIAKMGEPATSHVEILKSFEEKANAISKAQLIASQPLIDALQDLGGYFGDAIHRLLLERIPLMQNLQRQRNLKIGLDSFALSRDEHLKQMTNLPPDAPNGKKLFDVLNDRYEFEFKRVDKAIGELSVLEAELAEGKIKLAWIVSETHSAARRKVPKVLDEARKELELPIDIEKYASQMEHWIKRDRDRLENFISQIAKFQSPSMFPLEEKTTKG